MTEFESVNVRVKAASVKPLRHTPISNFKMENVLYPKETIEIAVSILHINYTIIFLKSQELNWNKFKTIPFNFNFINF